MAFFLKCKEVGVKFGIPLPPQEPFVYTNFIRDAETEKKTENA